MVVNRLGVFGRMEMVSGLATATAVRAPAAAAAAAGQAVEPGADRVGVDLLARGMRREVGKFLDAHLPEGLGEVERRHALETRRVASRRRRDFVRVVDLNDVDAVLTRQRREGVADVLWRRCRADRAEDGLLLLKAVAEGQLWMLWLFVVMLLLLLLMMMMMAAMVLVVFVVMVVVVMTMMK